MNKMNLFVVFGGVSSEHDISCISAASILRNADADRYHIYPVGITKSGGWKLFESTDYDSVEDGSWETSEQAVPALLSPDRETHGLLVLRESGAEVIRADCVFPVLHGIGGEDGEIVGGGGGLRMQRRTALDRLALVCGVGRARVELAGRRRIGRAVAVLVEAAVLLVEVEELAIRLSWRRC